jgi:hypothetical protein
MRFARSSYLADSLGDDPAVDGEFQSFILLLRKSSQFIAQLLFPFLRRSGAHFDGMYDARQLQRNTALAVFLHLTLY